MTTKSFAARRLARRSLHARLRFEPSTTTTATGSAALALSNAPDQPACRQSIGTKTKSATSAPATVVYSSAISAIRSTRRPMATTVPTSTSGNANGARPIGGAR